MHGKSNRRCAFFYTQWLAMANRKKKGEDTIRAYRSTVVLSVLLLVLSCCSLFVGVIDLTPAELLAGNFEQMEVFLISRLPRLLAILCTGIGMSVAGLIMQQLCSNKFVSPTTGATISSAQFGILLALLFMPASTLWSRAIFAFATAILGTWIFVWFIQRIQFKDVVMVPLDILDALGVGDRVVGTASTSLEYLQDYINDDIANLGTIKEADLEAVMACEPDVIFIGGRLASSYDALSEIAPVVYLATDTELGVVESVRQNATTIASMFGLEDKVDELMADFDARITALSEFAAGKTAIVGMCTSGSFNVLGNDGRCSIIGVEVGFENIGVDANIDTSTHGNEASFEFIVEKAADYIFVMDRDAAIGTDGAQLAQEIMENELVMGTDAYKNGNIVYLAHPAVWYTAEGGITALDLMLQDLESELLG